MTGLPLGDGRPAPRRLAFFGRGPIALACLPALLDRIGRGLVAPALWVVDGTLRAALDGRAGAAPVESADDRPDGALAARLAAAGADALISVQYGWILPEAVLRAVGGSAFNLHNAKLPDHRGHNAMSHVILDGDASHTVTLHWMQARVDTGFVAFEASIPVAADETAVSLHRRSTPTAAGLFERWLDAWRGGQALPRTPIPAGGRFHRRDSIAALKRIPDGADLETIDRIARAFHFPPHEPAYFELNGRRLHVVPAAGPQVAPST